MVVSELDNEYNPPSSSVQSERISGKDRIGRAILATFIAALGPLSFGYCLGYSSSALEDLEKASVSSAVRLTSDQGSWFSVSLVSRSLFDCKIRAWIITVYLLSFIGNVLHCKFNVVTSRKVVSL